jgi:hypothetical protein
MMYDKLFTQIPTDIIKSFDNMNVLNETVIEGNGL